MTTLETILIIYISLNWFLIIMFIFLPNSVFRKVFFLTAIVCPPLIIGFISQAIHYHIKEKQANKEQENE